MTQITLGIPGAGELGNRGRGQGGLGVTRRSSVSLVASPVLLGGVTTLILIVAVFLAYNANTGLPFVPTYDVWAQLPNGANLVEGNEVRLGGFRVGVVDKLVPQYDPAQRRTV